jgi:hypothetical protein
MKPSEETFFRDNLNFFTVQDKLQLVQVNGLWPVTWPEIWMKQI